jgi:YesN/AraC family two-component response regulator
MKPTIVIVDDIKVIRSRLIEQLHEEFEVLGEAASALEAIEMCQRLKPQLVLMDLVMPQMSGIDATREILATVDPAPKVIVLSGVSEETFAAQALDAGAAEYLIKPVDVEKLKSVLRTFADAA